jgi:hypothetical protein
MINLNINGIKTIYLILYPAETLWRKDFCSAIPAALRETIKID